MPPPAPPPEQAAATVTLYDRDGNAQEVPGDQVGDALRAGYLVPADAAVPMRTDTGQIELVSGAEAAQRAQSYTSQFASERDYAKQEEARSYDTLGQRALTLGAGTLNSLALGFGDAGVAKIGDALGQGAETRAWLQKSAEYNPGSRMVGEGLGFLAPLIASGGSSAVGSGLARGAGAAVRGATSGARALSAAGAATEGLVARGLARAGAAEGSFLARTLAPAAGQALEMGVYGAGQEVSRAVVRDVDLSGEQMAAAFAKGLQHGAMFGALGGAGLGAVGWAAGKAASKGLDLATAGAEKLAGRTSARAGETLGEKATRLADTLAPGGLEEAALQKSLKSTGANQRIMGKAEELSAEVRQIAARQVREDLPKLVGKEPNSVLSHVEQSRGAELLVKQAGEEIGQAIRTLDQTSVRPNTKTIYDRARVEVLAELKANPFTKTEAHAVETMLKDFAESVPNPTFSELHSLRRTLDSKIKYEAANPTLLTKAQKDVRRIIEDELVTSGERAAQEVGGEFAKKYGQLKREYAAAKWVEEATAKGAERDLGNRTLGLAEQLGGGSGASWGATVGNAVAGPAGGVMGGAIGGLAGAVAQHLVRKYGDQATAALLARAARTDLLTAATETVETSLGSKVTEFFRKAAKRTQEVGARAVRGGELAAEEAEPRKAAKPKPEKKSFFQIRQQVARAASTADVRGKQAVQFMQAHGVPDAVAVKAFQTQQKALTHLLDTLPEAPGKSLSIRPDLDKSEPPPAEQAKWLKRVAVVEDPSVVVQDLVRGTVSREQVETLREVYPRLYQQVREQVQAEVAALEKPPSYEQLRRLGVLLDFPATASQRPEFTAAVQATYQTQPEPPTPNQAPRRPINVAESFNLDVEPT